MNNSIVSFIKAKLPWRLRQYMAKYHIEFMRRYYDRVVDRTSPLITNRDNLYFEIHALLGSRHVGMCLWAVKSLLHFSGKKYSVVLHDDGSLTEADINKLKRHLIGVKIFRKTDADKLIDSKISAYPYIKKYRYGQLGETAWGRKMSVFSLKLVDFNLLTQARKILSLDTDVLFFKRPDEIVSWIDNFDSHETLYCHEYYTPSFDKNKNLTGFTRKEDAPIGFNSGLICLDRESFSLDTLELWLQKNKERVDKVYTFEQHAYNHIVYQAGRHSALPATYSFNYNDENCKATHFGIKPLFYKNIPRLKVDLK